jgi:hypothetical protein
MKGFLIVFAACAAAVVAVQGGMYVIGKRKAKTA